ncbi:MAG: imidazole glycerol phosphate synthase subunit HisH [Bifidobacteriaceae bacterium]|jgi:glutamine amidotransferase|nr:imidazole glycerol phosphate synthase subunit HisH [Bifidobacteriaceae bacterium]
MTRPSVVVLDYGFGNVRSAMRAIIRAGAEAELTDSLRAAERADGLIVPGVGAFSAVVHALEAVGGPRIVERRLAGGRAVLGICVGMQVMFAAGEEHGVLSEGLGQWPDTVKRLTAPVVPHMGWSTVNAPAESAMFAGVADQRFYFVHSYAAQRFALADAPLGPLPVPLVTWAEHGEPFVAAVEHGPLWATQFHPEKSGEAGARLLRNWVATLRSDTAT